MKNAEWLIKNGVPLTDLQVLEDENGYKIYNRMDVILYYQCDFMEDLTETDVLLYWLNSERTEELISKSERTYLRWVICPLLSQVRDLKIGKYEGDNNGEFIIITYKEISNGLTQTMTFPDFPRGTRYTGMELGKSYTMEELGID